MKRLISLASLGAGLYYLWTGDAVQENFVAMALIGFGVLLEMTVSMDWSPAARAPPARRSCPKAAMRQDRQDSLPPGPPSPCAPTCESAFWISGVYMLPAPLK
jgi:hypothetical protein